MSSPNIAEKTFKTNNFNYLYDLIHSESKEIALDSDIILSEEEESQFLEGIKLDKDNLHIDGNGHFIDAKNSTRIFYCSGKNITIENIRLKNGFAQENGGAIYIEKGEIRIMKSAITENTAKYGGSIYNHMGSLDIIESSLNENTAKYGGSIYNDEGIVIIKESSLIGNLAKSNGRGNAQL